MSAKYQDIKIKQLNFMYFKASLNFNSNNRCMKKGLKNVILTEQIEGQKKARRNVFV